MAIHSAYFDTPGTLALMRDVLRGLDRSVLDTLGRTQSTTWLGTPVPQTVAAAVAASPVAPLQAQPSPA
jgi:hypothetical protein